MFNSYIKINKIININSILDMYYINNLNIRKKV